MKNVVRAVSYTLLLLLATTLVIATVYISMWLVFGLAFLMLGYSIYSLLQAKESL